MAGRSKSGLTIRNSAVRVARLDRQRFATPKHNGPIILISLNTKATDIPHPAPLAQAVTVTVY
jgi:hypothetical protein